MADMKKARKLWVEGKQKQNLKEKGIHNGCPEFTI
jgi:hypothetical protein